MSEGTYWVILISANLPVYLLFGKLLFGDWHNFRAALVYWLTPDFWSVLQGEWGRDMLAELWLALFIVVCALVTWGEHWVLQQYVL